MTEATLPTGTVTFLLTDIEGSTKLWQWHEDVMGRVVERHDALVASIVTERGGVFVKSKGEGDSTFSVFTRPSDAVAAAADVQRALAAEPWPADITLAVRAALHSGEAELRDGDYYGTAVNRCARLRGAAHGGQVLCSQATRDLTVDSLPDDVSLRDLGTHRLRDLTRPERIFQLCHPDLAQQFPALRSLNSFLTNLPAQRTSFVGRERELEELRDLVRRHRLVTLTGVGGCGKTRLGLQVAADEIDGFPDGVFFVDVAPVTDPDVLPGVVATAVGLTTNAVTGTTGRPVIEDLVDFLGGAEALIVLDNCEHLIDACGDTVDLLLERCPSLHIVATSRELLGVTGEQTYAVPSLRVPGVGEMTADCVDLFRDRATAVRPGFELTPDNATAIGEICRRLDGIPLAVELAAAQVPHLSPQQIAERLSDRFRLLTGGRRRVQRQQTLGAALDWSYELLSEAERRLLRRLAVFPGSFSLAAAEAVCRDESSPNVLPELRALVAKSLVTTVERLGEVRYRLLETVRLYAEDKLLDSGEADAMRGRHRDFYLEWMEAIPEDQLMPGSTFSGTMPDHHNVRAALEWSAGEERFDLVARIAGRGFEIWGGGFAEDGLRWLEFALEHRGEIAREDIVRCLATAAWVSNVRMDGERMARFTDEALKVAGDDRSMSVVIATGLGAIYHSFFGSRGDEAEAAITEDFARRCIEVAEETGSSIIRQSAYSVVGMAVTALGQLERAVDLFDKAIALAEAEDNWFGTALPNSRRCVVLHLLGRDADAVVDTDLAVNVVARTRDLFREDLAVFDPGWLVFATAPYALALAATGRSDEARALLDDVLQDRRHIRVPGMMGEVIIVLAAIATHRGDWERASRLLAVARRELAFRSPPTYVLYRSCIDKVRAAADRAASQEWRNEGALMPLEEAVQYGLDGVSAAATADVS